MKATNNNTDHLFMDIFNDLLKTATDFFAELFKKEKPGTYTLKDIQDFVANRALEKINDIITIERGNFKCSFDKIKVFEYLAKFKKLSGAKTKLAFTNMGYQEKNDTDRCLCSFSVFFDKGIKTLTSIKKRKKSYSGHYYDNNVILSTSKKQMYATNGYSLKYKNIVFLDYLGAEFPELQIPFDIFRKLDGKKCEFIVLSNNDDSDFLYVSVRSENEYFEFSFEKPDAYIPFDSVVPNISKELKVTVSDLMEFKQVVKSLSKSIYAYYGVMLCFENGSSDLKVINLADECYNDKLEYKYNETIIRLSEPAIFTCNLCANFDSIQSLVGDWDGSIYVAYTKIFGNIIANGLTFGSEVSDISYMLCSLIDKCYDIYNITPSFPHFQAPIDAWTKQEINEKSPVFPVSTESVLDNPTYEPSEISRFSKVSLDDLRDEVCVAYRLQGNGRGHHFIRYHYGCLTGSIKLLLGLSYRVSLLAADRSDCRLQAWRSRVLEDVWRFQARLGA